MQTLPTAPAADNPQLTPPPPPLSPTERLLREFCVPTAPVVVGHYRGWTINSRQVRPGYHLAQLSNNSRPDDAPGLSIEARGADSDTFGELVRLLVDRTEEGRAES